MNFIRFISLCLILVLFSYSPSTIMAQTAPIPQKTVPFTLKSDQYTGEAGTEAKTFEATAEVVKAVGVPWIKLKFSDVYLGNKSYITVTSIKDEASQRLDTKSLAQWRNSSAYFNGDAVEIKLHVAPGDEGVFFNLQEIIAGEWVEEAISIESQCGPVDDRILSSNPASGRIVDVGCTGWIISNGKYVTAGHCLALGSLAGTLEFNVPESLPDGTIQHPGPEDQYAIDLGSFNFVSGGIGDDWGVFEVFNNSQTGLQPIDAQGASFTVVQNLATTTIRITGFGVDFDDANLNQTQQTHTGPDAGSSGTTMRYQTDTEGGNSGSPVIDESTGFAVGVHTHGGCSTSGTGNNSGTSTFNTAFWDALGLGGGGGDEPPVVSDIPDQTVSDGDRITYSMNDFVDDPDHADSEITWTWAGNSQLTIQYRSSTQQIRVTVPTGFTGSETVTFTATDPDGNSDSDAATYSADGGGGGEAPVVSDIPDMTLSGDGIILSMNDYVDDPDHADSEITWSWAGNSEMIVVYRSTTQQIRVRRPTSGWTGSETITFTATDPDGNSDSDAATFTADLASASVQTEAVKDLGSFPNPFNPSTTISYSLKEDSKVTVKIFNMLGQEVATLVDGYQNAGIASVVWNGTNSAGQAVASGTYIYRINTGKIVTSNRILFSK